MECQAYRDVAPLPVRTEFRMTAPLTPELLEHAADLISQADALIVAAGAGMGVDSGLPDFREKASGRHTQRLDANRLTSTALLAQMPSPRNPAEPGASMAIGLTCTAPLSPMPAFRF